MSKLENKFINVDIDDFESINRALSQKELAGTAKIVKEYEGECIKYFNSKYALACSSGTAGIELILRALGVGDGDEVILPPTAPVMSILPVMAIGATPVFCDVDSESAFGIDMGALKSKITSKTKVILVVPMWGYTIEMKYLLNFCNDNKIYLVEDVSHCHGSKLDNKYLGTLGHISIFSTQERKLVTTGEGGLILTDSDELNIAIEKMRNFGRVSNTKSYYEKTVDDFGSNFGLNFRLSALNAALGISQLKKLDTKIEIRKKNAEFIKHRLLKLDWITEISILQGSEPNYYSIVLKILDYNISNFELGKYLNDNGVISDTFRFDYQPLYQIKLFSDYKSNCPNAEILTKSVITLPTHEGLSQDDLNHITNLIINYDPKK